MVYGVHVILKSINNNQTVFWKITLFSLLLLSGGNIFAGDFGSFNNFDSFIEHHSRQYEQLINGGIQYPSDYRNILHKNRQKLEMFAAIAFAATPVLVNDIIPDLVSLGKDIFTKQTRAEPSFVDRKPQKIDDERTRNVLKILESYKGRYRGIWHYITKNDILLSDTEGILLMDYIDARVKDNNPLKVNEYHQALEIIQSHVSYLNSLDEEDFAAEMGNLLSNMENETLDPAYSKEYSIPHEIKDFDDIEKELIVISFTEPSMDLHQKLVSYAGSDLSVYQYLMDAEKAEEDFWNDAQDLLLAFKIQISNAREEIEGSRDFKKLSKHDDAPSIEDLLFPLNTSAWQQAKKSCFYKHDLRPKLVQEIADNSVEFEELIKAKNILLEALESGRKALEKYNKLQIKYDANMEQHLKNIEAFEEDKKQLLSQEEDLKIAKEVPYKEQLAKAKSVLALFVELMGDETDEVNRNDYLIKKVNLEEAVANVEQLSIDFAQKEKYLQNRRKFLKDMQAILKNDEEKLREYEVILNEIPELRNIIHETNINLKNVKDQLRDIEILKEKLIQADKECLIGVYENKNEVQPRNDEPNNEPLLLLTYY